MSHCRQTVTLLLVAAIALGSGGCTFFACSGDGPLKREELGNWAGLTPWPEPAAAAMYRRIKTLKQIPVPTFRPFAGRYGYTEGPHWLSTVLPDPWDVPLTPVPGYEVRGTFSFWLRLVPSGRNGHWVYSPADGGEGREFYAGERAQGIGLLLGDFLYSASRAEAFDTQRLDRVAARQMDVPLVYGLWSTRVRSILPVDDEGRPGLHALRDPELDPYDARYELKDGRIWLLGLFGWGRVNHRYYLQLLWVPIPLNRAGL
jgi:hypothetical protein